VCALTALSARHGLKSKAEAFKIFPRVDRTKTFLNKKVRERIKNILSYREYPCRARQTKNVEMAENAERG
jgi:hypothetical protein